MYLPLTLRDPIGLLRHLPASRRALAIRFMVTATRSVIGCSLAFIFYLNTQLSFSINQIIGAYNGTMATVYNTLTGDPGDPFPFFLALISNVYPASATAAIPGPVSDNPFPLGLLSFWSNNNTFSRDQAQDIVASQGGVVSNAFYLSWKASASTRSAPTGSPCRRRPAASPACPASTSGPRPATPGGPVPAQAPPIFEDPGNPNIPQRIRFSFDVVFTDESAFPPPAAPAGHRGLERRSPDRRGEPQRRDSLSGFRAPGRREPVFHQCRRLERRRPPISEPGSARLFGDRRPVAVVRRAGLHQRRLQLDPELHRLSERQFHLHSAQLCTDLLDNLPGQTGFETADSSVTPTDGAGHTAYNFAIARVRLRGTALDQAVNCRVFFRLFVAQSCDTDFQPSTTYKSTQGTSGADAGHPVFPLASAVDGRSQRSDAADHPVFRDRYQRHARL